MTNELRTRSDAGVFLAVARAGSTLAASRELGMSQNTVARRIDELEARLGLALFDRDTRGFRPTAAGRALIAPAEAIETAAQGFVAEAKALCPAKRATVRLTATEATFSNRFSGHPGAYIADNPGLQVDLISSDHRVDLAAGEADVAIRHGTAPDDDRLVWTKVGADPFAFYAGADYAARHGCPRSLAEVFDHPLVIFGVAVAPTVYPGIETHPRIVSRGDTVRASVAAVRAGMGIGALPVFVARNDPELVLCFDPPDTARVPTYVVASKAARRRPEVRRFANFVTAMMRDFYAGMLQDPTSGPGGRAKGVCSTDGAPRRLRPQRRARNSSAPGARPGPRAGLSKRRGIR